MKIEVQHSDATNPVLIMEAEGEAEHYQLSSITRILEHIGVSLKRWNNEHGRGITVALKKDKK